MTKSPQAEFSRLVKLDDLDKRPLHRAFEADDRERDVLARRLDLLSLDSLKVTLTLSRVPGGPLVRVEGELEADVVQRCIVTLGPVASHVGESFSELYGPPGFKPESGEEEDAPEPFDDGAIDAGELAAQRLSLALDPYPRSSGAELSGPRHDESGGERRSPFAVLEALRKKR